MLDKEGSAQIIPVLEDGCVVMWFTLWDCTLLDPCSKSNRALCRPGGKNNLPESKSPFLFSQSL
jgi:hypothetical protein